MKMGSIVIMTAFVCTLCMCAAGCDASALPASTEIPESSVAATVQPSSASLAPTVTPTPAPTMRPSPTAVVTAVSAAPIVSAHAPASSAPTPLSALGDVSRADLTGDGRRDTVLQAVDTVDGTRQLMVNGIAYDTGILRSDGETTFYGSDIDGDGATELVAVTGANRGALLRIYRLTPSELVTAKFTYTVPAELSDNGEEEYRENSDSLLFSGIDPIVSLGDGSFAVLSFGSGFQRYTLGPDMQVFESGVLPLDILTSGQIPQIVPESTVDMSE